MWVASLQIAPINGGVGFAAGIVRGSFTTVARGPLGRQIHAARRATGPRIAAILHFWTVVRLESGAKEPATLGMGRGGVLETVKRPRQQPAQPQYANYWAPLTRKRHAMPHPAQPRHTNYWAPRTQKRHQQEHRPQRPTESSDPTQHAKGRTGDRPGPRKGTTTR